MNAELENERAPKLWMVDYLTAVRDHGMDAWNVLIDRGHHPRQIVAKCNKATDRGWVNYGVSERYAWIERAGRAHLDESGQP